MNLDLTHTNIFNDANADYGDENYKRGFDYIEKFIKELLHDNILIQTNPKEKNIKKGVFKINPEFANVNASVLEISPNLAKQTAKIGVFDADENDEELK